MRWRLQWIWRIERNLPVLFYEGLTCSYPYANDRLHTFLLEGVAENANAAHENWDRLCVSSAAAADAIRMTSCIGWRRCGRAW